MKLGVSVPDVCGPVWWRVLHSVAEAIRDEGCSQCGAEAVDFVRFWHDLVNRKLGKPLHDRQNFLRTLEHVSHFAPQETGTHVHDSAEVVRGIPFDPHNESVWALLWKDSRSQPSAHRISVGTRREAAVPIGKVVALARRHGARELALVHNHPSGSSTPSKEDVGVTRDLRSAAAAQGIRLRDHYILAGKRVVSVPQVGEGVAAPRKPSPLQMGLSFEGEAPQTPPPGLSPGLLIEAQPEAPVENYSDARTAPQPAWLSVSLMPFQQQGVAWLRGRRRALLADEMGLGKTLQSIAWASAPEARRLPALVVSPASLKFNWERELQRARPKDSIQVIEPGDGWPSRPADWTIINYDLVERYKGQIARTPFGSVILDEAHFIKNFDAIRTRAVIAATGHVSSRLAVTGTPILNRPGELFSLLLFLGFMRLQDQGAFTRRYEIGGNLAELHKRLSPIMLRRAKATVLKDLPPKLHQPLVVPISNAAEYARAQRDFLTWLGGSKGSEAMSRARRAEALVRLNGLRQLAAMGKVPVADDYFRDCGGPGHKYVIFSSFKEPLEELKRRKGASALLYTGDVPPSVRQGLVDRFQRDPNICFFLGTIGAAGVGITLTEANRVVFLDLPWTPGSKSQAEDRAHRIGQDNIVEVIDLLARNTVDDRMAAILSAKDRVIKQSIEGRLPGELSQEGVSTRLLTDLSRVAQRPEKVPTPSQYRSEALDGSPRVRDAAGDCTELRLPLGQILVRPEKYQYRRGGAAEVGLDQVHVNDIFAHFDPNRFEPIVVRATEGGRYELLSGHHRLAAYKLALERGGFPTAPLQDPSTIPTLVRRVDEETARQLARLSNASIKEYKPSELAQVFRVEADNGLTPDQIGAMYGARSDRDVLKYLDISLLPRPLLDALDQPSLRRSFSVDHAAILGRAMREHGVGAATVQQLFDRVLKEQEYTANQLEKLVATFGPQLREVQAELFPGEEFKGSLVGILGLIRQAMDNIKELSRKRRLLGCVRRMVDAKEEEGESVSRQLRAAARDALAEIESLDAAIEGIRDKLGLAIRKQKAPTEPEPDEAPEVPEGFAVPKEQGALVAQGNPSRALRAIASAVTRRTGVLARGRRLPRTAKPQAGLTIPRGRMNTHTPPAEGIGMSTTIQLPAKTEQRLARLVAQFGRTKSYYLLESIERGLGDVEDYYSAHDVAERVRRGEERVYTDAEVRASLGLEA